METDVNNIKFDKDKDGRVLPTLRNKDLRTYLMKTYGSHDNIPDPLKKDIVRLSMMELIWSGAGIDLYTTKEDAQKAYEAKVLTTELDKKYLKEKK
jgi:succinate dehydrogenase/fumarate reductase flavoprotein subunit